MSLPVTGSTSSAAAAAAAAAAARQAAIEAAERARRLAEQARQRAAEAARQAKAAAAAAQRAQTALRAKQASVAKLKTDITTAKPAQKPKLEHDLATASREVLSLENKVTKANTAFEKAVANAGELGKKAVTASEAANTAAVLEGKKPPYTAAQVQRADDGFESLSTKGVAAKVLSQLRNERLSNAPIIGDQLLRADGVKRGSTRGTALADEVVARAKRELGGDFAGADPKDVKRALVKALRNTQTDPALAKDATLTGAGLDRNSQTDLAAAYGKGLGEGLRDALTQALGRDAGKILNGRVGAEVQGFADSVGKQIGERAFGPDLAKVVASSGKSSAEFVKADFNTEQAAAAAESLRRAIESGPAAGAESLTHSLKQLPPGARQEFLALAQDSVKSIGAQLADASSTEVAAIRDQIAATGKRGPELQRLFSEARIEAAVAISPEKGAEALATELEALPASQKRELVDSLEGTIETLGKALDTADSQKNPLLGAAAAASGDAIDYDALRESLDDATLAAGAGGGELALQLAEARITQAADGNEVRAAEALRAEIEGIPSVAGRAELLHRLGDTLETISEGAVGDIDEEAPRQDIIRAFSDIAEMSGRAGTEILAEQFADAQADGDETHTDVDDGNQLGGAFREVLYDKDYNPAFGIALAKNLKDRGGVGDAADDVAQGVYEGVNDKDPSQFSRVASDVVDFLKGVGETALDGLDAAAEAAIDVGEAALRYASDAFDFVTRPLTDAINGQIDKLGPGDSYKVGIGGGANIRAVGVAGAAELEITRGEDGGYTVALGGEIELDVAKKLKLPLTIGADGKVEFEFDSVEDAKRAAGTLAQIGGAAVAGSALPGGSAIAAGGAALANVGDGDIQFLASNVSAVEFGTEAAAGLAGKLGLPGMDGNGTGIDASVSSGTRARVEFGNPPSISFSQTLSGEIEAGLGAPGGQGISLSGSASAEFEIQHTLTLPEDFSLTSVDDVGDLVDKTTLESGVSMTLTQEGSASAALGPFEAGASGKLVETFSVKGNPLDILRDGVPKILDGDVKGAVKALDENFDMEASIEFTGTGSAGANATAAGIGVTHGEEIEARFKISGDPLAIVRDGVPELLDGDIPGAAKAVGDNVQVEAEISQTSETVSGVDINIDAVVAEANFVAQRTDVETDELYQYGVDEPRTATQAVNDLAELWGRAA
ncbi:MAG: hypothetical protein ACO1OB_10440 [Archangium sp.]